MTSKPPFPFFLCSFVKLGGLSSTFHPVPTSFHSSSCLGRTSRGPRRVNNRTRVLCSVHRIRKGVVFRSLVLLLLRYLLQTQGSRGIFYNELETGKGPKWKLPFLSSSSSEDRGSNSTSRIVIHTYFVHNMPLYFSL